METAFRSTAEEVLRAFHAYEEVYLEVQSRRKAFGDRYGVEALYLNRSGFGHGTEVKGIPGDAETEVIEGWRYSSKAGYLIPNLKTKVGKSLNDEMVTLRIEGPSLPGMQSFHLGGSGSDGAFGMAVNAPALFKIDEVLYAGWGCTLPEEAVDLKLWEAIPLSAYYLAKEESEKKEAEDV